MALRGIRSPPHDHRFTGSAPGAENWHGDCSHRGSAAFPAVHGSLFAGMTLMTSDSVLPAGGRRAASRSAAAAITTWATAIALLVLPSEAHASLLSPEMEDKAATFIAIFVLFIVPVTLIVLFWMVHILPEKIAHKRHHPQFEAIRTLCLLSLVFGGLLWPLAWIWAYTKPVLHKLAYGTDKEAHGETGWDQPGKEPSGVADLRDRLTKLEERGVPAAELDVLRADLAAIEAKLAAGGAS